MDSTICETCGHVTNSRTHQTDCKKEKLMDYGVHHANLEHFLKHQTGLLLTMGTGATTGRFSSDDPTPAGSPKESPVTDVGDTYVDTTPKTVVVPQHGHTCCFCEAEHPTHEMTCPYLGGIAPLPVKG